MKRYNEEMYNGHNRMKTMMKESTQKINDEKRERGGEEIIDC